MSFPPEVEKSEECLPGEQPALDRAEAYSSVLLTDSFPPHAGGSRVYYHNLYKRLSGQFGQSVVVLTKKVPGYAQFDRAEKTQRFRIMRRSTPLPNWKHHQLPKILSPLLHTYRLCRNGKVDLLHAGDLFPQGVIGMWAKKLMGIPYLAYAHGEEITQTDHYRYQPKVRNMVYRHADAVIAANEFARENLIRIGVDRSKILKITPGVDGGRFSPRSPRPDLVQRYGLQGKTVMLSVGRLVPHKGHSVLLTALSMLPQTTPPHRYLIAGEGNEKQRLIHQVETLGLGDRVTFVGKVPETELPDFYNLCDFFALANREMQGELEGFGMVFLEANASGKPVLGGRTGGTAEAIAENQTGLLIDPENVVEVAAALELLLSNPELRRRLGDRGRERAVSDFSWDASAGKLNEVCVSVLRRNRETKRGERR